MITDLFLSVLGAVGRFLTGLLPSFSAPAWLTTTLPGWLDTAGSYVQGVSAWFPFDHVPIVLGFVAVALAAAAGIKLARIAASFVTLGGGAAG